MAKSIQDALDLIDELRKLHRKGTPSDAQVDKLFEGWSTHERVNTMRLARLFIDVAWGTW